MAQQRHTISLFHPFSAQSVGLPEAQIPAIHSQPHLAGLRALADEGWRCRVEYLTTRHLPYRCADDRLEWRFWPHSAWQPTTSFRSERSWLAVAGMIAAPPDVLILNMSGLGSRLTYALSRVCARRGGRYIAMIGGIPVSNNPLTIRYLQRASSIIVHTESQRRRIQGWSELAACRIDVLPLGIDETRFDMGQGGALGSPGLLYVGRWQRWKGVHRTIEALAAVKRHYPQAKLHLIGPESEADYSQQIRNQISELALEESVIIHGPLPYDDLPHWYQAADFFLLLSDAGKESFGMVIAESMACGTPVVALRADEGGPAEIISDGVNGLLVDEADTGEAIARLYADSARLSAMRAAARQKILGHYTQTVTARVLHDIVSATVK